METKPKYGARTSKSIIRPVRVPLSLDERLTAYTQYAGGTRTALVIAALEEYLAHHCPIEAGREEARG